MTTARRHFHNSWFCSVCDKLYRTCRGATQHVLRAHDGMADTEPMAFRCDFSCKRGDTEPNGRVLGKWRRTV